MMFTNANVVDRYLEQQRLASYLGWIRSRIGNYTKGKRHKSQRSRSNRRKK